MKNSSAKEAWNFLQQDQNAVLVDVRTPEEWAHIGTPDLKTLGKETVLLTWRPDGAQAFVHSLEQAVPNKTTPLFFICRSGMRSQAAGAAAAQAGYQVITNVTDGFEDKHGPGTGWKACGLPVK